MLESWMLPACRDRDESASLCVAKELNSFFETPLMNPDHPPSDPNADVNILDTN
jgi:hypothetical protein